ncbi:MAG: glycosyltransferase [Salinivirgaceae bacterium]
MDINLQKNMLCYTYWSDTALLALSLLKKQNQQLRIITRTHRFDLYDDRNMGNHVPYRLTKYKAVDAVYCISRHGKRYLENKLPKKYHGKLALSYLGVNPPAEATKKTNPEIPLLVSCARMEPFKRISMIPEILKNVTVPLKWVHFGDGPEFDLAQQKIKELPPHIQVTLMGQLTNKEIHDFYRDNEIALFLSLSSSEGLPVSMMEAISYGIPIIATGVNGVPEIVTEKSGILLEPDESIENIADKIVNVITANPFNRSEIVDFYRTHFNAETNYANFAKEISNLL